LISKKLFAFYFSDTHNFCTLGNYEKYLVDGDIVYYDVKGSDNQWRLDLADISTVEGSTTTATGLSSQTAVFDTTV